MNAPVRPPEAADEMILKIAVLAIGGQGGGVLTNWIAELGTRAGYDVQMTSVAGVAQRTGATIYYVEMAPKTGRAPVFALSPSPGDVDILVAAELMEAGRAVLRGFITPDRTTLIASNHRVLAVSEKETPGDGRADAALVGDEILRAALKTECFDMESIAKDVGSMISASLFGGLARSGALPFPVSLFEEVVSSGRGAEANLAAFRGALNFVPGAKVDPRQTVVRAVGPEDLMARWSKLEAQAKALSEMAVVGLRKVVDYQDLDYGAAYLTHVEDFAKLDKGDARLTETAAKYIANAMCYDDLPRVADLKVRRQREARLRHEQEIAPEDIVHVTEYFHPRAQEVCASLPTGLGRAIEARPRLFKALDWTVNRGRRIRTDGLWGFGLLWCVSLLRPVRRRLLRHSVETAHLEDLMRKAREAAVHDIEMAAEILTCQRLIKGYSDTHARGHSKFGRVIAMVPELQGRDDGAAWLARLREAALQDEKGEALDGAIATVRSFTQPEKT